MARFKITFHQIEQPRSTYPQPSTTATDPMDVDGEASRSGMNVDEYRPAAVFAADLSFHSESKTINLADVLKSLCNNGVFIDVRNPFINCYTNENDIVIQQTFGHILSPPFTVHNVYFYDAGASDSVAGSAPDYPSPELTQRCFKSEFQGKSHVYLWNYLKVCAKVWDANAYYSPFVPIIESSMTGKSRTVVELSQFAYVIYLSFNSNLGYPYKTSYAGSIQEEIGNAGSVDECERIWLGVLSGFADILKEAIVGCWDMKEFVDKQVDRSFDLRDAFKLFIQKRWLSEGFKNLISARSLTKDLYASLVKLAKLSGTTSMDFPSQSPPSLEFKFPTMTKIKSGTPAGIVVAFDEISRLSRDLEKNSYFGFYGLRRALRVFPTVSKTSVPAFAVFLDTTSNISVISTANRRDPSLRVNRNGSKLFQPFYSLCNDEWGDKWGKDIFNKSADHLLKFSVVFRYGRRMWSAYIDQTGKKDSEIEQFVRLARAKLLFGEDLSNAVNSATRLAVFSALLSFNVHNYQMCSDLVSGYMQRCLYVDESRSYMKTLKPADPILAHAAWNLLQESPEFRKSAFDFFADLVKKGVVTPGENGELVAQYILVHAYRRCDDRGFLEDPAAFPKTTLTNYLTDLFGGDLAKTAIEQLDDLSKLANSAICVGDGLVNAQQVIYLNFAPNSNDMCLMFARGQIGVLKNNAKGADAVIPVFLPRAPAETPTTSAKKLDHIMEKGSISFIVVQIRNRVRDENYPQTAYEFLTPFYSDVDCIPRSPYLTLYMNLYYHSDKPTGAKLLSESKSDRRIILSKVRSSLGSIGGQSDSTHLPSVVNERAKQLHALEKYLLTWPPNATECNQICVELEDSIRSLKELPDIPDDLWKDLSKKEKVLLEKEFRATIKKENAERLSAILEAIRGFRQVSIAVFGLDEKVYPCLAYTENTETNQIIECLQNLAQNPPNVLDLVKSQIKAAENVTSERNVEYLESISYSIENKYPGRVSENVNCSYKTDIATGERETIPAATAWPRKRQRDTA